MPATIATLDVGLAPTMRTCPNFPTRVGNKVPPATRDEPTAQKRTPQWQNCTKTRTIMRCGYPLPVLARSTSVAQPNRKKPR